MIEIKNTIGNSALVYAKTFEGEAYTQIEQLLSNEAYCNSKIRIMPDAHAGKGCTVGTTMTITDKITPNLVGVDIGCGMLTVELAQTDIDFEAIDKVINSKIPAGFNVHDSKKVDFDFSNLRCADDVDTNRALLSLGTLGGGNHFIEISKSEKTGNMYLVIHTGSRKLGTETCRNYQEKAGNHPDLKQMAIDTINALKAQGRQKEISLELKKIRSIEIEKSDLDYIQGQEFDDYMNDMQIVQKFATLNRHTIADIILDAGGLTEIKRFETIHNYIDFERMILRKGAVSANKNEMLLIPINMRDGSLLCIGKGNADWNYSAPHGAGRLMSRSKARKNIDLSEFTDTMKGVYTTSVGETTLDEAPQAYKSMEEIIETITPTAKIVDVLKPIYNYKAH